MSVHLQQFIVESLHPKILSGQRISNNEFEQWSSYITHEAQQLSLQTFRLSFASRKLSVNEFSGTIRYVTGISNIVNGYLTKYSRAWQNHPDAAQIRKSYLLTCRELEMILDEIAKKHPAISGALPFTDYAAPQVRAELRMDLARVEQHLKKQEVGVELTEIVIVGIHHLVTQKHLLRNHALYLRQIMNDMLIKEFSAPEQLIDYLITNDFNLPEFFLFCVENWSNRLTALDGLFEQSEMLLAAKSHLYDISLSRGLKFPFNKERLYTELNKFLSEKYYVIKERLKISRQQSFVDGQRPRAKRVLVNLSVAQFGLFIRLQVEKGILMKEHIGELFAFYARHFYTPNTDFISPESLQKKSTDVEHATAQKLKAHLIAMINWLNTNYNLSNFN